MSVSLPTFLFAKTYGVGYLGNTVDTAPLLVTLIHIMLHSENVDLLI